MMMALPDFIQKKAKQFLAEHNLEHVYDINCGLCEEFAKECLAVYPNGEIVDLGELYINDPFYQPENFQSLSEDERLKWIYDQDLPCHYAFLYEGKYYDAQNYNGVEDWKELDLMKYGQGQMTRNEYISYKQLGLI